MISFKINKYKNKVLKAQSLEIFSQITDILLGVKKILLHLFLYMSIILSYLIILFEY